MKTSTLLMAIAMYATHGATAGARYLQREGYTLEQALLALSLYDQAVMLAVVNKL